MKEAGDYEIKKRPSIVKGAVLLLFSHADGDIQHCGHMQKEYRDLTGKNYNEMSAQECLRQRREVAEQQGNVRV